MNRARSGDHQKPRILAKDDIADLPAAVGDERRVVLGAGMRCNNSAGAGRVRFELTWISVTGSCMGVGDVWKSMSCYFLYQLGGDGIDQRAAMVGEDETAVFDSGKAFVGKMMGTVAGCGSQ